MKNLQPLLALAPKLNSHSLKESDLVALRLDQLEAHVKYSVIYEIARIETMLKHSLAEACFQTEPRESAQLVDRRR
jgi:hypothetical protein